MLGVLADDPDNTFTLNDLAFVTDRLNRSSDFHDVFLYCEAIY